MVLRGLLLQANGSLIANGYGTHRGRLFAPVLRFLPNGSLDELFGSRSMSGAPALATTSIVQAPDGTLVVAGYASHGVSPDPWQGYLLEYAVARFTTDALHAVEYYNAGLDHFFITADPDEIAKLDSNILQGWVRTGYRFTVADVAPGPGLSTSPVCRFYGLPTAGLDSHFYSASPLECGDVRGRFPGAWVPESDAVFRMALPDGVTGRCPIGSLPIYRSWNGRTDSNHRYTFDFAVQQAMIAGGSVAEGNGSPPVAMCAPQ